MTERRRTKLLAAATASLAFLAALAALHAYISIPTAGRWGRTPTGGSATIKSADRTELQHAHPPSVSSRPYERCKGTASERRSLAGLGSGATPADWTDVGSCTAARIRTLTAHFFLHVSKSAGTSVCRLVKRQGQLAGSVGGGGGRRREEEEKPRFSPPCLVGGAQRGNCHTPDLGTGNKWVRDERWSYHGMSRDMVLSATDDATTDDPTCREISSYLRKRGIRFFAKENYLPRDWISTSEGGGGGGGGGCAADFWTSIVLRDPMERMLSHYRYLHKRCKMGERKGRSKECDEMLYPPGPRQDFFNVSHMAEHFDLITDNYYVRSLSDRTVFASPFGTVGRDGSILERSLEVLTTVDWIMIMGGSNGGGGGGDSNVTDGGGAESASDPFSMILRKGLGLAGDLERANSHQRRKELGLADDDAQWLRDLNRPDFAIWDEARRLHALDVKSIRSLEEFAPEALLPPSSDADRAKRDAGSDSAVGRCCGLVC